jgi:hypothetical protein
MNEECPRSATKHVPSPFNLHMNRKISFKFRDRDWYYKTTRHAKLTPRREVKQQLYIRIEGIFINYYYIIIVLYDADAGLSHSPSKESCPSLQSHNKPVAPIAPSITPSDAS